MPEQNEQQYFNHGYDNSRLNLDDYDPIAPDLLDQINIEAALACEEEDEEEPVKKIPTKHNLSLICTRKCKLAFCTFFLYAAKRIFN